VKDLLKQLDIQIRKLKIKIKYGRGVVNCIKIA